MRRIGGTLIYCLLLVFKGLQKICSPLFFRRIFAEN